MKKSRARLIGIYQRDLDAVVLIAPWKYETPWKDPVPRLRAKIYGWGRGIPLDNLFCLPQFHEGAHGLPVVHPYYTQIEVAAGIFGSVRLGINPGEFLDPIVGFFGLDLYADDVEEESEEAKKAEEPPGSTRRSP